MKKNYRKVLLGGILLCVGIGIYSIYLPRVCSQNVSGGKWEYKILVLDSYKYSQTKEFRRLLKKYNSNATYAKIQFIQSTLNQFGNQGWELIQVIIPPSKARNLTYYYFKRFRP